MPNSLMADRQSRSREGLVAATVMINGHIIIQKEATMKSSTSVTVGPGGVRFDQGGGDCLGNFRMRFRRLVPMNMDSPGSGPGQAQVKSGMTERGRKNPGSFSRPSPRSRIKSGMTDPGSISNG